MQMYAISKKDANNQLKNIINSITFNTMNIILTSHRCNIIAVYNNNNSATILFTIKTSNQKKHCNSNYILCLSM